MASIKVTMEQQPPCACERNQNKNKIKSCHIRIDHAFSCSIWPTNNAKVSLMDDFPVDVRVKRKISCQ